MGDDLSQLQKLIYKMKVVQDHIMNPSNHPTHDVGPQYTSTPPHTHTHTLKNPACPGMDHGQYNMRANII